MTETEQESCRPEDILKSLHDRLATIAPLILGPEPAEALHGDSVELQCFHILEKLVSSIVSSRNDTHLWLVVATLALSFPEQRELLAIRRFITLASTSEAVAHLMEEALVKLASSDRPDNSVTIVQDSVIVECDYSAKSDFHNGVQRTVRELLPRWQAQHSTVVPVVWSETTVIFESPSEHELDRTLRWHSYAETLNESDLEYSSRFRRTQGSFVIPWNCTIVFPDIPRTDRCLAIAAIGEFAENRVVGIGYDMIPILSNGYRPHGEAGKFANYLTAIKYFDAIAGISASALAEFSGYGQALGPQGRSGPKVCEVTLPVEAPSKVSLPEHATTGRPHVLLLGRLEPHKNQLAVLEAACLLWREGIDFDLTIIGNDGCDPGLFAPIFRRLRKERRPLHRLRGTSDADVARELARADFTVFVSLHEGYGLPVAESLAVGTPVITSNYGSQAEIAADGGALVVDPRSDAEILAAMRNMLTDTALRRRLAAEARNRPSRGWDDYAADLWAALIESDGVCR